MPTKSAWKPMTEADQSSPPQAMMNERQICLPRQYSVRKPVVPESTNTILATAAKRGGQ